MLSVRSMIFQTFRSKNFFHALSTFVYVLSLGIVIQIPGIGEYFEGLRPLLFLSLLSALIFYMTGFNRKFIMFSVIYVFLFVSSSLIPMLQEELIPRKEIISSFLFGGGWLAFWSLIILAKLNMGFSGHSFVAQPIFSACWPYYYLCCYGDIIWSVVDTLYPVQFC